MTDLEQIRAEMDAQNRAHDELLKTLEVPEYSDRTLTAQWVQRKSEGAIEGTTGWTAGAPAEVLELLQLGDPYILETKGFSQITGWIIRGRWYGRKSEQDLQREYDEYQRKSELDQADYVAKNREDWERREAALPEWAASRMRAIREATADFEVTPMGWGYELIATELAVLYAAMGDEILDKNSFNVADSPAVTAFAQANGTSGFQHQFAIALAQHHLTHLRRGRHFAPYGSTEATCGETIPRLVVPSETTGEYTDDRFTTSRARTTCEGCQAKMTGQSHDVEEWLVNTTAERTITQWHAWLTLDRGEICVSTRATETNQPGITKVRVFRRRDDSVYWEGHGFGPSPEHARKALSDALAKAKAELLENGTTE